MMNRAVTEIADEDFKFLPEETDCSNVHFLGYVSRDRTSAAQVLAEPTAGTSNWA